MARTPRAPWNGPTLLLTLHGGSHLTEFDSFFLKAIRGFDSRYTSGHVLRGPTLRVQGERTPPLNEPIPYVLPADARAVYVFGRSAHGAPHDIHAVLQLESSAQATVLLSLATEEKRREVARLARLLASAEWQDAVTMMETNPHSYSRRSRWVSAAAFEFAVCGTRRYGWRQPYVPPGATKVAYRETVFEAGAHFYWSGWQPPAITGWINRKPLPSPVEACVVDQVLRVEGARVLDIPRLSPEFAGLDPAVTQCPFFQAGVALFGWPLPNTLPRLVRRRKERRA